VRPRFRVWLAVVGSAGLLVACATIAGIEEPSPRARSKDAGVDGTIETGDGVTISPSELALPAIQCQESQSAPIVITNNGGAPASFEVAILNNATFSLRGAPGGVLTGTVERAKYQLVYVEAKGVRPGPQSVDVVVRVGSSVRAVNAKVDVRGGLLSAAPSFVDFGDVRSDTQSGSVSVELKNEGNEQLSLTGWSGVAANFVFSKPTLVVPAGGVATVDVYMTPGPPSDVVPEVEVKPQVSGVNCGDAPTLTLRGKRVSQDVTVGPLSADFGDAFCGSTPSKQAKITLTNYTASAASFSTTLLSPSSRFVIVGAAEGSLPGGGGIAGPSSTDIVVGVKPVGLPLGEFDEDLQIDVLPPVGPPMRRIVKLHVGAYGAILEASPSALGSFDINQTKAFAIRNVGNARTCVAYAAEPAEGFGIEDDDVLNPGEENDLRVEFRGTAPKTYESTIQISRVDCAGVSAPICVAAPTLAVSAKR